MQKGIAYEVKNYEPTHSHVPHQNRLKNKIIKHSIAQASFTDFTGHKQGTLTVERYVGKGWSCRCVCGEYEIRTTKSIKNHIQFKESIEPDMCETCRHMRKIKEIASARAQGYSIREYQEKFTPRHRLTIKELKREAADKNVK